MMTSPELTERTVVEKTAVELGWVLAKDGLVTVFTNDAYRIRVYFSDNDRVSNVFVTSSSGAVKEYADVLSGYGLAEWLLARLRRPAGPHSCPPIRDIETSQEAL